jgi:hypothetical protein
VVDTINELAALSRKLNQKSDKTNSIIATINKKIAVLNFGLEVWLEFSPIESGDLEKVYPGQTNPLPRQKSVTYLGYCNVEDAWQLAAKNGTLIEDWDKDSEEMFTELTEVEYRPLLKAAREVRVGALPLVPRLLEQIKLKAESLLRAIDEAEKAADALTDGTDVTNTKLTLREFARSRTDLIAGSGPIFQYIVEGLPRGQEASIANMRGPNQPRWQILRTQNKVQGSWTGEYETATHALAALEAELNRISEPATGVQTFDYRIERDGTTVVLVSERATQRGTGPRPQQGARLAFRTTHDTLQFVRAAESEGFLFEGKEIFGERGRMPTA